MEIPKQLQNSEFRFIRLQKKSKRPIRGESWKNHLLQFDNKELLTHLKNGGNYGVVAGYGNLRILDVDDLELGKKLFKELKVFTVKTCGGGYHFYFLSNDDINRSRTNLGEYRANNMYVVGPNCYVDDWKKNHHGNYSVETESIIQNED